MLWRAKKNPEGRLWLMSLLALWVGLGIALAPGQPLPQAPAQTSSHHLGHASSHSSQPVSEPNSSESHHGLRCVLCLVGAGTLPLVVRVVSLEARLHLTRLPRRFLLPKRSFRLFRSRAPPWVGTSFRKLVPIIRP